MPPEVSLSPPATPANAADRIASIDLLRGFAAIAVVLFHYTTRYHYSYGGDSALPFAFPYGHYGVNLFFVISGFVICMTIERCRTAGEFVVSRFSRLYPVFWVCVLLTFLAAKVLPLPGVSHSAGQLIANLTMFNEFFHVSPIDGAYWSLTYELGFYIAVLALFMFGQIGRIEWFCWLWVAGAIAFHFGKQWIPHPLHFVTVINAYGHLFAAGIAFYRLQSRGFSWVRALILPAVAGVQLLTGTLTDTFAIILCLLLVAAALRGWLNPICHPALLWLGAISYPLYLIHEIVGWTLLYRLYAAGATPLIAISVVVCLMLGLSSALHVWVEMPGMRWIRRRYKQRRQNRSNQVTGAHKGTERLHTPPR